MNKKKITEPRGLWNTSEKTDKYTGTLRKTGKKKMGRKYI